MCHCLCDITLSSNALQDIAIETISDRKNSVQGPLLLKLLFVSLKNNVSIYSLKGQYCKEQWSSLAKFLLPPAKEVWGKAIFSQACVKTSVHRGGGAWSRGGLLLGGAWWRTPRDSYCCGRYASYWNAFLLCARNTFQSGNLVFRQ